MKNDHNITYLFSKVVLHKDYGKPQDYENDIALIQLDKVVGKKEGNFELLLLHVKNGQRGMQQIHFMLRFTKMHLWDQCVYPGMTRGKII